MKQTKTKTIPIQLSHDRKEFTRKLYVWRRSTSVLCLLTQVIWELTMSLISWDHFMWPEMTDTKETVFMCSSIKMTSSNGYSFRVTGHLCGEFPAQRPVTRRFDIFFDMCLNKRLRKQSWGWWFETLSRQLWRHWMLFVHEIWYQQILLFHMRCLAFDCQFCLWWSTR